MQSEYCKSMSAVMRDFRKTVVGRLDDMNVQQKEIAARAGFKPSYLSWVLSGRHNVTMDTFLRVAEAVGIQVSISYRPLARSPETVNIFVN